MRTIQTAKVCFTLRTATVLPQTTRHRSPSASPTWQAARRSALKVNHSNHSKHADTSDRCSCWLCHTMVSASHVRNWMQTVRFLVHNFNVCTCDEVLMKRCVRAFMRLHACERASVRACAHACVRMPPCVHACTHACERARVHLCMLASRLVTECVRSHSNANANA